MRGERLESLSWADLMRRLANNVASIVDKEIELAKEEAHEDISHTIRGASMLIVGVVFLLTAWISFVVAGILALSIVIDNWLAAIIVGVICLIVGAILALVSKSRLPLSPLQKTRESLREDVGWVKRQTISSEK